MRLPRDLERRNRETAEVLWSVVVIIYAGLLLLQSVVSALR